MILSKICERMASKDLKITELTSKVQELGDAAASLKLSADEEAQKSREEISAKNVQVNKLQLEATEADIKAANYEADTNQQLTDLGQMVEEREKQIRELQFAIDEALKTTNIMKLENDSKLKKLELEI